MNAHAHVFRITREEIVALRYLKCPKRAAEYLGITAKQVKAVWAEVPDERLRTHNAKGGDGSSALAEMIEDAKRGSERLLAAYTKFFAKWEKDNNFRPGAGKFLLPAGWVQ